VHLAVVASVAVAAAVTETRGQDVEMLAREQVHDVLALAPIDVPPLPEPPEDPRVAPDEATLSEPTDPDDADDALSEPQPEAPLVDAFATFELSFRTVEPAPEEPSEPEDPAEQPQPDAVPPEQAPSVAPAVPGADVPLTAPVLLADSPNPVYPAVARRRRWEGDVVLAIDVDARGRVTAARVEMGSGHQVLDDAAREGVLRWRFRPARRGSEAVATTVRKRIRFDLDGAT
jgi:protein TonB